MKNTIAYKSTLDKISAVTSILCLIHCVLLPVLFSTLPLLGVELIENIYIETATVLIAAIIGSYAIVKGFWLYHKKPGIVLLFAIGLAAVVLSNFIDIKMLVAILKIAGAAALVTAHILNRKTCKDCITCNGTLNK